MLRSSLITASAVVLCCTATAQQQIQAKKMISPVKDAGIYHMATGTWTRTAGSTANLGPDIIYRADAPSGYFGVGWEGSIGVDEGVLPGPTNSIVAGPQTSYDINCFIFNYCSQSAGLVDWSFGLYSSYVPCDDPDMPANCIAPSWTAIAPNLPSGGFCWTALFNLTGIEATLQADGGPCAPGYQGHATGLDHFGWAAKWFTTDGAFAGPILDGGDPTWVPEGEGTCYSPAFTNPCAGLFATGLGAQDLFGIGNPLNGCFWFGGYNNTNGCGGPSQNPFAQFHFVLATDCSQPGTSNPCDSYGLYCGGQAAGGASGNGYNFSKIWIDTCDCSAGSIFVSMLCANPYAGNVGYLNISAGGNNGTVSDPPGAQGDLCLLGGPIGRYNKDVVVIDAEGFATTDILNATTGGGGGNIPTLGGNVCSPGGQTFNFQYWHRDGMNPSRFSKALTVTLN